MNIDELRKRLGGLSDSIDDGIEALLTASEKAQEAIYKALREKIMLFQIENGAFLRGQSYNQKLAVVQREIYRILGETYTPALRKYLSIYPNIEDTSVTLQKAYNGLEVGRGILKPAKESIYAQAEYYLSEALADAYVQPVKYLILQQVTNGSTIKQMESLLKNWNDGTLTAGKLATGRPTPALQRYASVIATDAVHQYSGTLNDIIANEYGLKKFIYVGGIIKDSRPFCRHLIGLQRKINIEEIPKLLEQYPDGTIPGTTRKNFLINRGGYNCRHVAMPVKD